jgi:hypothetical protein
MNEGALDQLNAVKLIIRLYLRNKDESSLHRLRESHLALLDASSPNAARLQGLRAQLLAEIQQIEDAIHFVAPTPSDAQPSSPTTAPVDTIDAKAIGYVDQCNASEIAGWAYYSGRSDTPMTLNFYFDGNLLGSTAADLPRPDVKRAGYQTDVCGFVFKPPVGAFEKSHMIEVRASNGQIIRRYTRNHNTA